MIKCENHSCTREGVWSYRVGNPVIEGHVCADHKSALEQDFTNRGMLGPYVEHGAVFTIHPSAITPVHHPSTENLLYQIKYLEGRCLELESAVRQEMGKNGVLEHECETARRDNAQLRSELEALRALALGVDEDT